MGVYAIDRDLDVGRRIVDLLKTAQFGVQAALWLYFSEADQWRLVIATPLVQRRGPMQAYGELQKILLKNDIALDLSRISLVSPKDPFVQGLRRVFRNRSVHGERGGMRFKKGLSDYVFVDDAYVYYL